MLTNIPAERLCAIVSSKGSSNSHVAILARAMGILSGMYTKLTQKFHPWTALAPYAQ